jgi:hypothetical protein
MMIVAVDDIRFFGKIHNPLKCGNLKAEEPVHFIPKSVTRPGIDVYSFTVEFAGNIYKIERKTQYLFVYLFKFMDS